MSPRIGDVIFCTPAIHALKSRISPGRISVLAMSEAAAQVFENSPDVDELHVLPSYAKLSVLADEVDFVIDFHSNDKTARWVRWLGKPALISPRSQYGQHQSEVATDLICRLFSLQSQRPDAHYRLYAKPEHILRAADCLTAAGARLSADEILVGCHMGTYSYGKRAMSLFRRKRLSTKAWPPEFFDAMLEDLLPQESRIRIVMTGTAAEAQLIQPLKEKWPDRVSDISGQTTVLELKACIERMAIFVCPDTGPLHVASSTSVPLLYLSSKATCSTKTGPYPPKNWHHTIHSERMIDITPGVVAAYILKMISDKQ